MSTCPKCHRPVEDGEEYICCATVALGWRCGDCGKVSEGFAFPYGLCPACGGELGALEDRRLEGEALEAVRDAFEIELGGMAFYARAAREAADPALGQLFGRFAEMEAEHMATLSRRYHVEAPKAPPDLEIARAAVYSGAEHRPEDPENLFRLATALERRAVKFFTDAGAASPTGSMERQLYKELAAEEQDHVTFLATELARYRQGKPGMLQNLTQ
jgi:rubrerythrin